MAEPKPIAEQIVSRALQVQRMGSYIGAFELAVWSSLQNVKVGLVVGGSVHQMREWFMPALPEPPDSAGTHYLVACNFGTSRQLHPVDTFAFEHPQFHHYVIGAPLPGHAHASVDPVSGSGSLRAVSVEHSCRSVCCYSSTGGRACGQS